MIGQPIFFAAGPEYISGNIFSSTTGNLGSSTQPFSNLYLTGTGYADEFSARSSKATTGQITGLSVASLYLGSGYANRIESTSEYSNSGVFNYLGPTGRFFPPLLTFDQRISIWSGIVSPSGTIYDGMMCFQTTSGQQLMIVQSGIWKTATLV